MGKSFLRQITFALVMVFFWSMGNSGHAQMSGSRGGAYGSTTQAKQTFPTLDQAVAQSVITVEGKAVESVKPSSIRIVLALTYEGETSRECKTGVEQKIAELRPLWTEAGVADDKIVEDFISILPRFKIGVEKLGEQNVAMEKKTGYLMQTNIHLAVKDEAEAMKVLDIAFANGVTDIIGFDYWSDELDQKKQEVRSQAIEAAKAKAELLLGLFSEKPPVVNVQENTVVIYPDSMYESFQNTSSNEYQAFYNNRRNVPLILLPRPKNTYYRGNLENADTQIGGLPMHAELSVVSTVRIYYESPAAKDYNAGQKD